MPIARLLLAIATTLLATTAAVRAETTPLPVVASFSILGDMTARIGGEHIALTTLVGPDGDAHVYEPRPADVQAVAAARVLVVNGLGFEGWIERLKGAAGFQGRIVTAGAAITPRVLDADEDHDPGHEHTHDAAHDAAHGHDHGPLDPHAWQDVGNAIAYVTAIAAGLAEADPANAASYRANAETYRAELQALDARIRTALGALPPERRRIVTSHDAFGYFAKAYGLTLIAAQGVSTDSEASAADVAQLIRQIRAERIRALFVENVSDPRLLEQIARESGAVIGGTLYSDALSGPDGPAATYVAMMEHNLAELTRALAGS